MSSQSPIFDAGAAFVLRTHRLAAADTLAAALERSDASATSLATAMRDAAELLGADSALAPALLESPTQGHDVDDLERNIERWIEDLRYEPALEAPVPVDWPPFAPTDRVVLKQYPQYRMAQTSMDGQRRSTTAFMKLFEHIQSNDIAMTAPVQMDDGADSRPGRGENGSMAFLYREASMGETGRDGAVEVVDVAPMLTISIGLRGYRNDRAVQGAVAKLEAWLAANPATHRAAGPVRVLGYHGPMTPAGMQFFEVEIPVEVVTTDPVREESDR